MGDRGTSASKRPWKGGEMAGAATSSGQRGGGSGAGSDVDVGEEGQGEEIDRLDPLEDLPRHLQIESQERNADEGGEEHGGEAPEEADLTIGEEAVHQERPEQP